MKNRSNPIEVSVVIATHNQSSTLQTCLEALAHQTLDECAYEILVVDHGSTDDTWPTLKDLKSDSVHIFRQQTRGASAARNRALKAAKGEFVLFLHDDVKAQPDLLSTHLATHRSRPESHLCVLGTVAQSEASLCNPFTRYLEENDILLEFGQMLPMDYVPAQHFYTDNISVSLHSLKDVGFFDESFYIDPTESIDLGFRLESAGHKVLYTPMARGVRDTIYTLSSVQEHQRLLAEGWVQLFKKHPERLREWGDLRLSTRGGLEDTSAIYEPKAHEREEIIEQLTGFHFDSDPVNPVGNPDTQRRLLKTIDEQFQVLNALWWSQGFADGLYEHHLSGFDDLLQRAGRIDDLIPQRTLLLVKDSLHPLDVQALYDWSAKHDEFTAGGLVITTATQDVEKLDAMATQIASTLTRARPDTKPAAVHLCVQGQQVEDLKPLFLATDNWLAIANPWERSLAETAMNEGCTVDWLVDSGVVQAPNLPGNIRIGLWPDWNNYTDLLTLIDKWWPALSARKDCSLVLFHSKDKTSRAKRSAQTLQELLDQSSDGDHTAHVITALAPKKESSRAYWRQNLDGIIQLESGHTAEQTKWLSELDSRVFRAPIDMERHLVGLHLLTDQLLGHAPLQAYTDPYEEVHEQIS